MSRTPLIATVGFVLTVLGLSLPVGQEIHVPIGSGRGPLIMSGLGPSEAATALPNAEVADGRRDFYFRQIEAASSTVSIPLQTNGPFSVGVRADSTVRTRVRVNVLGKQVAEAFIATGPWAETRIGDNLRIGQPSFDLNFEDAPLVRRSDTDNLRRYVDELVLRSDQGFQIPWSSRLCAGLLLVWLVLATRASPLPGLAFLAAVAGPAALTWIAMQEPVGSSLALPRLLGFVLLSTLLTVGLCRMLSLSRPQRAALCLLGGGLVLGCGFLSFLPNHSPADLDIHIWRAVDLAQVPTTYDAWLRYGSHYPTPSQIRGAATEALGQGPAIPYSPLPYVFFYAAHALGLDLHWSMNALEATALALLLPLVFAFARIASSSDLGGLLAATLMALDLATIHHLGRAHSPAVFGGALGLVALLAFGLALSTIRRPGQIGISAVLLGLGALGYSSTPLFYGLFGVAALALLALQKETNELLTPVAMTLVAGGLIALALFYGHYIPGLMRGGSNGLIGDPFPGRTFFVFHNESRQSLRLWRLGLFVPFLAAIPATWIVISRCSAIVRTFLLSWLAAWAGVMLLKEPWALPLLLRWAKEDFYVAPALTLVIAVAVARVESRPVRIALTAACVITALCLRINDYGFHADTLRFVR